LDYFLRSILLPILGYGLLIVAICVWAILTVRLIQCTFRATQAVEQIGRAMEEIAVSLHKNRT